MQDSSPFEFDTLDVFITCEVVDLTGSSSGLSYEEAVLLECYAGLR